MESETIIHLILDFLMAFLSPTYVYDFFIEVFSRDYFINDHFLMEKKYISLAIVMLLYSPFLWFFLWLLIKVVKYLLEIIENDLIFSYLFMAIVIVLTFLWVNIVISILFSIGPTLIKGLFNA